MRPTIPVTGRGGGLAVQGNCSVCVCLGSYAHVSMFRVQIACVCCQEAETQAVWTPDMVEQPINWESLEHLSAQFDRVVRPMPIDTNEDGQGAGSACCACVRSC